MTKEKMKEFCFFLLLLSLSMHNVESATSTSLGRHAISLGFKSAMSSIQRSPLPTLSSISDVNTNVESAVISDPRKASSITNTNLSRSSSRISSHRLEILRGGTTTTTTADEKNDKEEGTTPKAATKPRPKPKFNSSLPPVSAYSRPLSFWENMVCGAVSRSIAQTIMHPANTMKTILQARPAQGEARMTLGKLARPSNMKLLTRGAGAQLLLSVPHGAVNFAVLEFVRRHMNDFVENRGGKFSGIAVGPGLDFLSSAISTVCCSVVSTPQMMITDNIMAGTYPNLPKAVVGLTKNKGVLGFYSGWWPGLAGKIPSYGLTWALFQQLKRAQLQMMDRPPKDIENSIMGCMASATTVCVMIPMDTVKTRLVTQLSRPELTPYSGIIDCAIRVYKEEGIGAFYRGLAPRLVSVVPMIGIQFGVYEFMKKVMMARGAPLTVPCEEEEYQRVRTSELEEIMMEVAADDEQPFPAPYFSTKAPKKEEEEEMPEKKKWWKRMIPVKE